MESKSPPHQKTLSEIVLAMKTYYEEMSEFIEKCTQAVCPGCESVCCIDRHGTPDEVDTVYFIELSKALGNFDAVPHVKALGDENLPCRYLGDTGCGILRWQRPFRCTWFFCAPLLEFMPEQNAREYRNFMAQLQGLQNLREKLSLFLNGTS